MNLKQLLSELNIVIEEAVNGIDAIEKVMQFQPDIVTLDITMPEMDGITALQKIKEVRPETVVIMCSAMGQTKSMVRALELGAKEFIVKPYRKEKVLATIGKYL